ISIPGMYSSRKRTNEGHIDGPQGIDWIPRNIGLALGGIMRRRIALTSGMLVFLLSLWTGGAHARTFNLTDDTYSQQGNSNTQNSVSGGSATSLVVANVAAGSERITYALFDPLALLPLNTHIDKAVLRIFVDQVTTPGQIRIYQVTGGAWTEQSLTW